MRVFNVRNVQLALPDVLGEILRDGIPRESRNGPVLMFDTPITIEYKRPQERVLFWPERDANPFFHFFESLWMLAGKEDVAFPAYFAKQILEYSDDGLYLHGAYGFRWRFAFCKDQLASVIRALRKNRDDRRQVIQMWSAAADLGESGKDIPCNLVVTVQVNVTGALDIVVMQRSGDLIWGVLGANAVHFSVLQEYLALAIGVPVGRYYQVTHNAHVYCNKVLDRCRPIALDESEPLRRFQSLRNPYEWEGLEPFPLFWQMDQQQEFDEDLETFFELKENSDYRTRFFKSIVLPMHRAHQSYKQGSMVEAMVWVNDIEADDWRMAAKQWLLRRKK